MYYDEILINGVWHWRGTPDGEWTPFSVPMLHQKIKDLSAQLADLRRACAWTERV